MTSKLARTRGVEMPTCPLCRAQWALMRIESKEPPKREDLPGDWGFLVGLLEGIGVTHASPLCEAHWVNAQRQHEVAQAIAEIGGSR